MMSEGPVPNVTETSSQSEGLFDSIEVIAEEGIDTVDRSTSDTSIDSYVTSNDWCKLLFQDGYLKVLKQFALSGELQRSNIRAVCWKLFLGIIPEDQSQWSEQIGIVRRQYEDIKKKHLFDPHSDAESSLDLAVNNPLSLEEESPWNQFFQDSSLKGFIQQDIVRTHPEQQFFRQTIIQTSMLNILFCYAKEHPNVLYRQGMHELLAPILFVLHAEDRGDVQGDNSLRQELKTVIDPNYIEHDAFALFAELMETMQQFYLNAILEADYAMARERIVMMKHDPRVVAPFESKEIPAPTSAIARKLDKIHDVFLKRTDEQLYIRLQHLGIPPQTYGIRWIRLLFSREFLLPSVLELWDALFADGPSLSLIDHFFVVMLMQFREKMLVSDYSSCMQLLMQYPVMFEVPDLVQNALHLRNPIQHPKQFRVVREWTTLDSDDWSHPLQIQDKPDTIIIQENDAKRRAHKFANKTKQVLSSASKQMMPTKQIHLPTKLQVTGNRPITNKAAKTPTDKDIGEFPNQEMVNNPKTRPQALCELEKIKEQLDNSEAKCLYCGRKMEAILEQLQNCLDVITIPEDSQDTMYLGIAGLKQIRDLLLHKLPFSGEFADYESLTAGYSEVTDNRHDYIYVANQQTCEENELTNSTDSLSLFQIRPEQ